MRRKCLSEVKRPSAWSSISRGGSSGLLGGLENIHRALVMHGELSGHPPLFLLGEDVIEIVVLGQWPMRGTMVSRTTTEASIVVFFELEYVRIRVFYR